MADKDRYLDITDEELIQWLRDGDDNVSDYLCDKYKGLVKSQARSMYILGAEPEDLIQEGMIGLFKAMRDYDAGRDASFYTFAKLCISRQMYTAVQFSNRQKHMPLNSYISIYASGDDSENKGELLDEISDACVLGPEDVVIEKENVELLEQSIEASLSDFEKQVLDLHLTGMGYVDIAKVLGKDEKSTDNALQRIRSKIRRIVRVDKDSRI